MSPVLRQERDRASVHDGNLSQVAVGGFGGATGKGHSVAHVAPVRSGRFALNLVANVGQLGLSMIVGAWYVPFLVRHLGPAAYGLIPLTSTITSYMALITASLNAAVGMYLTIALEREDHHEANLIFNVSLCTNAVLSILLLMPASVIVVQAAHILRVPAGYETATRWLFAGTLSAFLLNQIRTPFGVSFFCRNRLDLENLVIIAETLTRVGMVVCLFLLVAPRVEYVGAAILAGTVVSAAGTVGMWKKLTPTLHIRLKHFDWTLLKRMGRTGGWEVVSRAGAMLYLSIDLIVANRMFGAEQGGYYAAVLQLPALLRTFCYAAGGIFTPTMVHIYARGDIDGLVDYLNRSIKFLGLLLALPIGLMCGFSEPLLRIWLGPTFSSLATLLLLMSIHLCINLAMFPLYALPLATNRVKAPGLATLAIGVGNLILALCLTGVFTWGLYGLAAAGAIMLTVRHLLITPLYAAHILNRSYSTFYRQLLPIVLATLLTTGLCRLISWCWAISGWTDLAMAGFAVSLLFVAVTYLLLPVEERSALKDAVMQLRKAAGAAA